MWSSPADTPQYLKKKLVSIVYCSNQLALKINPPLTIKTSRYCHRKCVLIGMVIRTFLLYSNPNNRLTQFFG